MLFRADALAASIKSRKIGAHSSLRGRMTGIMPTPGNGTSIMRRRAPNLVGVVRRVGKDDQRGLKAFGPMNRHHPNSIGGCSRIALHLHFALPEPGEETVQGSDFLPFERQRRRYQLLDRIPRCFSEPPKQFSPAVDRPRQDRLEETTRRDIVGHGQPTRENGMGLAQVRLLLAPCCQFAHKRPSRPYASS